MARYSLVISSLEIIFGTKSLRESGTELNPRGQKRELEFWAIIVTDGRHHKILKRNYSLTNMALSILEKNVQLRDSSGSNPLCAISDIFTQRRHEKFRGELVEAMNVRIRPTIFVKHGS